MPHEKGQIGPVGSVAGSAEREKRYNALFELLAQTELAARNGQWMTCGSQAKRVTALAYQYGNDEANTKSSEPDT